MKTSESRSNLPKKVDLKTTSNQLSYIAEFVHSLNNEDYELMGKLKGLFGRTLQS